MTDVIKKYGMLTTLNDEVVTDELLKQFIELPEPVHHDIWIRDAYVGNVGVYMNDRHPDKLIEVVMGADESSVTTLFARNPIFYSRTELADARKDIINEIGAVTQTLPSVIGVHDVGRGRDVMLREMSTAQLLDILAQARNGQFGISHAPKA